MPHRSYFLLLLLIISGCATATEKVAISPATQSITIVSGISDTINLQAVGTTVFENESYQVKQPEFSLNTFVEETARETLSGRFNNINVISSPTLIGPLEKNPFISDPRVRWVDNYGDNLKSNLYIFIYHPTLYSDNLSQRMFYSIGVAKRKHIFSVEAPIAHVTIAICLIDSSTHTILSQSLLTVPATFNAGKNPYAVLEDVPWKGPWTDYDQPDREKIRTALQSIISAGVPYTFAQMGLITTP